jgi:hypothetical protein
MKRLALLLPLASLLLPLSAQALPGQDPDDVAAWIQAHPTLRPRLGERLTVRKSDTAAQRFIFQASMLPPGALGAPSDEGVIRKERIEIFDTINGVSRDRLEEALRAIYGIDIYQDYQQGQTVYDYPTDDMVQQARARNTPILEARQGELRLGDRFAYWIEVAQPREGTAITGHITVLLESDLDRLEAYLRNR